MRLFDEIIPASNVFGCLIDGSFQGRGAGDVRFFSSCVAFLQLGHGHL